MVTLSVILTRKHPLCRCTAMHPDIICVRALRQGPCPHFLLSNNFEKYYLRLSALTRVCQQLPILVGVWKFGLKTILTLFSQQILFLIIISEALASIQWIK